MSLNIEEQQIMNGRDGRPITHQSGFTLVELMVSVVLGMILINGVIQVFLSNKQTYQVTEGLSRMQENARFALDILVRDMRMIGYMGCSNLNMPMVNVVDLNKDGNPDEAFNNISTSLEGFDHKSGSSASGWEPNLSSDWHAGVSPKEGTDVILVSRMDDEGLKIASEMPSTSAELKVTGVGDIKEEDVIMITDCQKGATFGVTQVQQSAGHLQKNTTLNTSKTLTSDGTPFGQDASIYRVLNTVYYIADSAITNSAGDNPSALWRSVNGRAPEELVAGLEDLEILYGEDTGTDRVPDRYVSADGVTDMENVVAVRFRVTANSIDAVDGDLLTRGFTQTVMLRNRGAI